MQASLETLQRHGISHEGLFGINRAMRYREHALPEGTQLYVLGVATPGPDGRLLIGKGEGTPFLISTKSEETLLRRDALITWGCGAGALILLALTAWLLTR